MVCLQFDGINHEWVIRYQLEGVTVRTVRVISVDMRDRVLKEFLANEHALACGEWQDVTRKGRY